MIRIATLAVVVAVCSSSLAHAGGDPSYRSRRRAVNVAVAIGASALYEATDTFLEHDLAPGACRWCAPPAFDVTVRDSLVWHDRDTPGTASGLVAYVALPALSAGLVALGSHDRIDDLITLVEAGALTDLVAQSLKFTVARQRPRVRFGASDGDDDNLSFVSAHTAFAFGIVTSAGVIAHRRGSASERYIWAIGLPLAAATGYLRMAADEHWLSDVIGGAAVGVAVGAAVPIVATPRGLAVVGTF